MAALDYQQVLRLDEHQLLVHPRVWGPISRASKICSQCTVGIQQLLKVTTSLFEGLHHLFKLPFRGFYQSIKILIPLHGSQAGWRFTCEGSLHGLINHCMAWMCCIYTNNCRRPRGGLRVLGGIRVVAECRREGRMGVGVRGEEKEGSCELNFYFRPNSFFTLCPYQFRLKPPSAFR